LVAASALRREEMRKLDRELRVVALLPAESAAAGDERAGRDDDDGCRPT